MTIQEMIARQQAIVDGARKEGRGLTREEQTEFDQIQGKIDAARNAGGQDGNQGGGEPPAEGNRGAGNPGGAEGEGGNDDAARQAAVQAERQRNSDIVALCRQVGMDPAEYIRGGQTMDQVRQRYTPQIASRLEGEYRVLPFYGEDIRLLRKQTL